MRASGLFALLSCALFFAAGPRFASAVVAPLPVAVAGLSANGCPSLGTPAAVSCSPGSVVKVASVFYGRKVPAVDGWAWTCPRSPLNPADNTSSCALPDADQAAATALVALSCDGLQNCSPDAASIARLFPDPCPGVSKQLEVDYACLVQGVVPQKLPTAPPAGDLYKRRPSTWAAPKCPKFASAVQGASSESLQWSVLAQGQAPVVSISLVLVDADLSKLDSLIKSSTGNAVGLDIVAFLNLTAVNVIVPPGTTIIIGKNNPGFTTVRIRALNIIGSSSSIIDVRSNAPNAAGIFGPDVSINAANVFGALQIQQNGLTALHPSVASTSVSDVFFDTFSNIAEGRTYIGACGLLNAMAHDSTPFTPPPCSAGVGSGPSTSSFAPLCSTSEPTCRFNISYYLPNEPQSPIISCGRWAVGVQATSYYGEALLAGSQADGNPFKMFTDRITYPSFTPYYPFVGTFPAKSSVYGSSMTTAAYFYGADGDSASSTPIAKWGADPAGVFSTADYTINLDMYPSQPYLTTLFNTIDPDPSYSGLLGLQAKWSKSPPSASDYALWTDVLKASCPDDRLLTPPGPFIPVTYLNGTIIQSPSVASPGSFPGPDTLVLRLALDCMEEMAVEKQFIDARAFGADLLRNLNGGATEPGPAAYKGKLLSRMRKLQTDETSPLVRDVPFMSAGLLAQNLGEQLKRLVAAENAIEANAANKLSILDAANNLRGSADIVAYSMNVSQNVLNSDLSNFEELSKVADKLNETYRESLVTLEEARQEFIKGLKAWRDEKIAFLILEIIAALALTIATDGLGIGTLGELVKDGKTMKEAERAAKVIELVAKVLEALKGLVEQMKTITEEFRTLGVTINTALSVPSDLENLAKENSESMVSLSVGALSFLDLHDQGSTFLATAINNQVEGAANYSYAMQATANAGYAMVQSQIQVLNAQGQVVEDLLNVQAATAQYGNINTLLQRTEGAASGFPEAYFEAQMSVIEGKLRALQVFHGMMDAFSFANTNNHPMENLGLMPDLSSTASTINGSIYGAMQHVGSIFEGSSCFCNASWIITDPGFIGNLSANHSAWLDLTNVTEPNLYNVFGGYDNVHIWQMNVKPYGIKLVNANGASNPIVQIGITPLGTYKNTFSHSGVWYERQYLAKPYQYSLELQPLNDWNIVSPGSLATFSQALVYMPTPYSKFLIQQLDTTLPTWDWSGVWGMQIELWGSFARPNAVTAGGVGGKAGTSGAMCTCPSPSSFVGTGSR